MLGMEHICQPIATITAPVRIEFMFFLTGISVTFMTYKSPPCWMRSNALACCLQDLQADVPVMQRDNIASVQSLTALERLKGLQRASEEARCSIWSWILSSEARLQCLVAARHFQIGCTSLPASSPFRPWWTARSCLQSLQCASSCAVHGRRGLAFRPAPSSCYVHSPARSFG